MSEIIDRETVLQVAKLANIEVGPDQAIRYQEQLSQILHYVAQLGKVALPTDIEPYFGASESSNAVREDQITSGLPREKALENAPDSDGEFFLVPPVFG